MTMLHGVAAEDLVDPDQVVFELAPQGREVLLVLEVGEDLIGKEESRAAKERAGRAGEMMQLAEHPGEGRLPALVRTRHDDDPLRIDEVERVAHDVRPIEHELAAKAISNASWARNTCLEWVETCG